MPIAKHTQAGRQLCCPTHQFARFGFALSQFAGREVCSAPEDPSVRGEREWNSCDVIHAHAPGHGNRRHLGNLHRPFTHDVAAEDHTVNMVEAVELLARHVLTAL